MEEPPSDPSASRARVVVLAGPSGSGKSRLAGRLHTAYGWPIVRLDNFYRDGDDPALPIQASLGIPDWDDPRSWHAEAALEALATLIETGHARMPVYDLAQSRATGFEEVVCESGRLILAEGIFAAEIIGALHQRGLLHSAWCLVQGRKRTFVRRLARDLAERRKPPGVLLQRGRALYAGEPATIRRQVALGARQARPREVERILGTDAAALG